MRVGSQAMVPALLAAGLLLPGSGARAQDATVWEQRVELKKGDFLHIEVRQLGMDAAVALQCPDGKDVLTVDDREDSRDEELLAFLAEADGPCRVVVRPSGARQADGRVEVVVEGPRAASARDGERLAAVQALAEGLRLERERAAESRRRALAHLERAAQGYRSLGDRRGEARAVLALATTLVRLPETDRAIDALSRVQPLLDPGDHQEALALKLGARAAFDKGQPHRALELAGRAVVVCRAMGDAACLAGALYNFGLYHHGLERRREAMALYEESVALARAVGARKTEAWSLGMLGVVYTDLGDYRGALDTLDASTRLLQSFPDGEAKAWSFVALATPHLKMGDYRRTKEYAANALEISESLGNPWVDALLLLSAAASGLGESAEAQRHLARALELSRRRGETRREYFTLIALGNELSRAGDRPAARMRYVEALALNADRNPEVRAEGLRKLCGLEVAEGNLAAARERCTDALQRQDADDAWAQITSQHLMGRLEGASGRWKEARAWSESALRLRDRLRGTLAGADQRAMASGDRAGVDEFYLETLMTLHGQEPGRGLDVEAFEAAERARARSLVELLAVSRGGLPEGGADPALTGRERELRRALQTSVARHARLTAQNADAAEITEAAQTVREAEQELLVVENTTRTPLTSLTQVSLAAIQKEVLDSETLLLVYALGEKRSFLWAVSQSSFATHELPGRAVVEGHVRKAYAALSQPGGRADDELAALGRLLLGPVAPRIGRSRLAVVADGALQYVPFAALRDPSFPKDPLLVRHEIVGLPSAASAVWLRRGRLPHVGDRQLAVLADPVFDAEDARLARRVAHFAPPTSVVRSAEDVGITEASLPRLPFSRREATAIARLAPKEAVRLALDFDASRALITDPDLGRYRYLHFATHGFLNSSRPELSGLVLSLVDREGRTQEGFLTAADIFTLKLSADLVVLSGCRTALGQEVRGEGLLGLTRAFLYAGAGSVVASLWRVDDAATAELMAELYRGLLNKGLRPSAALRQAQLRLWKRGRRSDPFYWAAFQIQGSWN
jgi:CHAT domain-containing protein/tetratricopeptide (TPR) repeat protein